MYRSEPHADRLRAFDLPGRGIARALADRFLAHGFPEEDAARIEQLGGKANEVILTDEEEAELEAYIIVNDLLSYWQSRAGGAGSFAGQPSLGHFPSPATRSRSEWRTKSS